MAAPCAAVPETAASEVLSMLDFPLDQRFKLKQRVKVTATLNI
jgi:hypothetical protein